MSIRTVQPSRANTSRNRVPLIAMLAASTISNIGNSLTFIAVPWLVLETTGSASKTGLVAFAGTFPMIASGLIGGIIADRAGHRRTSIVSDIASGATVGTVALLFATGMLEYWQLLALVFLGSILDMPGHTARNSMFPDVVELAGTRLERANAAKQVLYRFSGLIAPPLAGVLIAVMGTGNVLWLDAVSFAVSSVIMLLLVPARLQQPSAQPEPHAEQAKTPARFRDDLLEGVRFIRQDRLILTLMVTFALGAALAEPLYAVVLPVYTKQQFGSAVDLGLMFSALAVGSLAGNLVYGAIGHRLPRRETFIAGWVVRAASFWVLIMLPPLPVLLAVIAINGLVFEPGNPLFSTIMQERVPAELRGRVFGAFSSLAFGALPLGLLLYGFLLEGMGLRDTLLVLAILNAIPVLSMFLLPAYREMNQHTTSPAIRPVESPAR